MTQRTTDPAWLRDGPVVRPADFSELERVRAARRADREARALVERVARLERELAALRSELAGREGPGSVQTPSRGLVEDRRD